MTSVYVIIGIIVLCIGIGIQRLVVFLYNKQRKDIKNYMDNILILIFLPRNIPSLHCRTSLSGI